MQLVERSRNRDQNADAMIIQIRNAAKAGSSSAKAGYQAIENYIKANPIKDTPSFGEDLTRNAHADSIAIGMCAGFGEEYVDTVKSQAPVLASVSLPKAIVTVANGPSLLPASGQNLMHDVRDSLDEAVCSAFLLGIKHGLQEMGKIPVEQQWAFILGHVLGTARKIQAVRCPNVPLSLLSPSLGAEFQERG